MAPPRLREQGPWLCVTASRRRNTSRENEPHGAAQGTRNTRAAPPRCRLKVVTTFGCVRGSAKSTAIVNRAAPDLLGGFCLFIEARNEDRDAQRPRCLSAIVPAAR